MTNAELLAAILVAERALRDARCLIEQKRPVLTPGAPIADLVAAYVNQELAQASIHIAFAAQRVRQEPL